MPNQELWVSIFVAIIGLAIVSVIFSKNSQTAGVIGAAGSAFSGILKVAVSPVTGGGGGVAASPGPSAANFATSGVNASQIVSAITPLIGAAASL